MKTSYKIKGIVMVLLLILAVTFLCGCNYAVSPTDTKQKAQQEQMVAQSDDKLGLPNITNFYEKGMMKTIMEKCDDASLITYAYSYSTYTGKYTYIGMSQGYGLPYGTQYTNPQKISYSPGGTPMTLPQCDPNGLFKAEDVNATWLMLVDPNSKTGEAKIAYIESDVCVFPCKLPANMLNFVPEGY